MTHTITHVSDLKPAIARSISHDELVLCMLRGVSRRDALDYLDQADGIEDCDSTDTLHLGLDKPMTDVWGTHEGEEFRLYLVVA
jgi:hypothetical protein